MLTEQRQQAIMNAIDRTGVVQLRALVDTLHASESTVRRDLAELEAAGRLQRVHGGAQRLDLRSEPTIHDKATANAAAKAQIAAAAVAWLHPGMQVFLDAGTATAALIPHLAGLDLTIVTTGVDNAKLLADAGIDALIVGGRLKPATLAVVGADTVQALSHYRFDLAILGVNGIDLAAGLTTPDPEEAATKRQALAQASQSLVLADASKFDRVSFAQFAALSDATILTQSRAALPAAYRNLENLKEAQA